MSTPIRREIDVESAVSARYSDAARAPEASLCCPTTQDPKLLAVIPEDILERDYGCGNPAPYVKPGETVVDLGSGSGKACFIASQVVGAHGRVIGVDMNDDMLALARSGVGEVAARIGYGNVEFVKGRIQDLGLDLEWLEQRLQEHAPGSVEELSRLQAELVERRDTVPLVASNSVDVVLSNCVLNLVRPEEKQALFREISRVLRRGGRAVISDIVSDEDIPEDLQNDPELWSGCISGAFREDLFLQAFEEAGFYGVSLLERHVEPWRTVAGIEFRSVTVVAYKGKEGACLDQGHAVIYRGPFRQVEDDDGHVLRRGVPTAVCEKTARIFSKEPYRSHVEIVEPREPVPLEDAPLFECGEGSRRRDPREIKGAGDRLKSDAAAGSPSDSNGSGGGCC